MNLVNMECCGIREIANLEDCHTPKEALKEFIQEAKYEDGRFRYAVFSDIVRRTYGLKFAAFIRANKLGDVISTGYHVNPNSHNRLKVWVWTINHVALKRWSKKNPQENQDEGYGYR